RMNLQRVRFESDNATVQGDPVWITQGARWDSLPAPSPGGEWLVFSSAGKEENIILVRPDGSDQRNLTIDSYKNRLPRWSPDGNRIAFYSNPSGDNAAGPI